MKIIPDEKTGSLTDLRKANIVPETRRTEIMAGGFALWWSFQTIIPGHIFATNASFGELAHLAPEAVWTVPLHVVCFFCLLGWFTGVPWHRFFGAILSFTLWLFVAGSFLVSAPVWHGVPLNTGMGVYFVVAVLCGDICRPLGVYVAIDMTAAWQSERMKHHPVRAFLRTCRTLLQAHRRKDRFK